MWQGEVLVRPGLEAGVAGGGEGGACLLQVGDERDAARPEAGILGRTRDVARELGRELAPDGRDVDANLLEHAAAHQADDAAAPARPVPGLALEAAGREAVVVGAAVGVLELL